MVVHGFADDGATYVDAVLLRVGLGFKKFVEIDAAFVVFLAVGLHQVGIGYNYC